MLTLLEAVFKNDSASGIIYPVKYLSIPVASQGTNLVLDDGSLISAAKCSK